MLLRNVLRALWDGRLKLDWVMIHFQCVVEHTMTATEVEDEIAEELAASAA